MYAPYPADSANMELNWIHIRANTIASTFPDSLAKKLSNPKATNPTDNSIALKM